MTSTKKETRYPVSGIAHLRYLLNSEKVIYHDSEPVSPLLITYVESSPAIVCKRIGKVDKICTITNLYFLPEKR